VYTEGVEGIGGREGGSGWGKVEDADDSCHLFLSYMLIDEYEFHCLKSLNWVFWCKFWLVGRDCGKSSWDNGLASDVLIYGYFSPALWSSSGISMLVDICYNENFFTFEFHS
jgi:hypothetical protein